MKPLAILALSASLGAIAACETTQSSGAEIETAEVQVEAGALPEAVNEVRLGAVLGSQPDEVKARYVYRNPGETLTLFEIEPGMTVIEALPGGGWYSKIIMQYLGTEGTLVGAHYPDEMWATIFGTDDPERLQTYIDRTANWPSQAAGWEVLGAPQIASYQMTKADDALTGSADAALFIRALHNLHRSEAENGYMSETIAETYNLLKPGGVVGVVQHRAPEEASDEWASGSAGYLKQSYIVAAFEAAGFVLEEASELNANPLDKPTESDIVWRLKPSLGMTEEGTPEHEALAAIGESDRMTLKFRKPA